MHNMQMVHIKQILREMLQCGVYKFLHLVDYYIMAFLVPFDHF